jgi:hypothetical protein
MYTFTHTYIHTQTHTHTHTHTQITYFNELKNTRVETPPTDSFRGTREQCYAVLCVLCYPQLPPLIPHPLSLIAFTFSIKRHHL